MSCNCGKPKCKGQCGCKSPAVLQINNPSTYVSFHKVTIPASMGDSTTNPPENGKYRNTLVWYEADNTSWLYSSDGIPTEITGPQGPQGEQGPAGTIEIGITTTGEAGTDAEVENVGTPENAILNFTIPRGEQGEQGIQGETGPQGYMNEQDVRDVVDTIVPEGFFDDEATVSDCGTEFELENLAGGSPKSLRLNGDILQQSYTGKNLFNKANYLDNAFINAGTGKVGSGNGFVTIYAQVSPSTELTISKVSTSRFTVAETTQIPAVGDTVTVISATDQTSEVKTVTTSANVSYLAIMVKSSSDTLTIEQILNSIQIEEGPIATSYEPYVGGQPSPSPEYPQPVQTVTGSQTVTVTGKNLFDFTPVSGQGMTTTYDAATGQIHITGTNTSSDGRWSNLSPTTACNFPAGTYTLSTDHADSNIRKQFRVNYEDGTNETKTINYGGTSVTFTTTKTITSYFLFYSGLTPAYSTVDLTFGIMLEAGENPSAFEPYHAAGYPLDLGAIELARLDTYQDYIWKDGEDWKVHKETAHETRDVEINGLRGTGSGADTTSETGAFAILSGTPWWVSYASQLGRARASENLGKYLDQPSVTSNVAASSMEDGTFCQRGGTNDRLYFRNAALIGKTGREVRAIMLAKSGGTNAWWPLEAPTDTTVTDQALIDQLENIRLNSGSNIISLSSDGLSGELCVDAYADNWSGTISSINDEINNLNRIASKEYLGRSKYLNLRRIMREVRINSRNPAYSSSDYYGMQGGIYIGDNLFIQASPKGNDVQLKEFNLSNDAEIRSTVLSLQHANSLAYNPILNEVYATSLTSNNVYTHYVYVIDYATLTIKRTLELDLEANEGTHSVSYDNVTGKTYVGIETKSVNTFDLYELDVVTGEMTAVNLINYKNMLGSGGATNDMCIANNKMYLLKHSPAVLAAYDLETGKCENIFNIPTYTEFGIGTGEVESVSYDYSTGDLIIAGTKSDCQDGWVTLFNYFRTNLAQGISSNQNADLSNNPLKIVYVDAASTNINPSGTSWANAFKTIGEALERLNDERVKSLEIYVKEGTYPYVSVNTPKSVAIRGADAANRENQIIQGIDVLRCNNFFMSAVAINRPNGGYDADITLSNAFITATAFRGTHDEHIHVYFSKVEFFNLMYNATLFRTQAENMLISNDAVPNYKIAGSMPAVNKPVQIAAFSSMSKTAVTASYAGKEPLVETASAKLGFIAIGYYGYAKAEMVTQTTDGGNRNFCVMLDSKIITIQIVFNKTEKTLSARITKAIDLKSGELTDITDAATLNGTLYFEY